LDVPRKSTDETTTRPRSTWMLFDDLVSERVINVDILDQLEHETPYLLFYEIIPMHEDPRGDPPSYEDIQTSWVPDVKTRLAANIDLNDFEWSQERTTVRTLDTATTTPFPPSSAAPSPRLAASDAPSVPRFSVEFSRDVSRTTTTSGTDMQTPERRGRHSTSSLRPTDMQLAEGYLGANGSSYTTLTAGAPSTGSLSASISTRGAISAPATPAEELEGSKGGFFGTMAIGRRLSRRDHSTSGMGGRKSSRPNSQVGDITRWFDSLVKKHSTEDIISYHPDGLTGANSGPLKTPTMTISEDSDLAKKLSLLDEDEERVVVNGRKDSQPESHDGDTNPSTAEASAVATTSEGVGLGLLKDEKVDLPQRKSSVFGSLRRAVKGKKKEDRERSKSRSRLGLFEA
jgi:hypothetical protein